MPLLTLEIHADPTKEILKGQDEQPKIIKNSQSEAIIFSFLKEVQIKNNVKKLQNKYHLIFKMSSSPKKKINERNNLSLTVFMALSPEMTSLT